MQLAGMAMKTSVKSWRFFFSMGMVVVLNFSYLESLSERAECSNICSDAINALECTSKLKQCTGRLCYTEGSGITGMIFNHQINESIAYFDTLNFISVENCKETMPKLMIRVQLAVRKLSVTTLCNRIGLCGRNKCQSNVNDCPRNGRILPISDTMWWVDQLKMSFSCIKSFREPLSKLYGDVRKLDLSANILEEIPNKACVGMNITELILCCNRIKKLSRSDFTVFSRLTYLDLSSNHINEISENSFHDMQNLRMIKLNENYITTVYSTLFLSNNKLKIIDLSQNGICNATGLLTNLSDLEEISFENNKISELPVDFFVSNIRLKAVNFHNNSLQQLPFLTMKHGTLNFSNNMLRRINYPLTNFKNVSTLDLSFNCLQILAEEKQTYLPESQIRNIICCNCCLDNRIASVLVSTISMTVDLRHNPVHNIDNEFLMNVSHLKTVLIGNEDMLNWNVTFTYPMVQDQTKALNDNPKTIIKISENSFLECDIISVLRYITNVTQPPKHKRRSDIMFELHNVRVGNRVYKDAYSACDTLRKKDTELNCPFTFYCPVLCECYTIGLNHEVVVNCSSNHLTKFPTMDDFSYPVNLYLRANEITELPQVEEFDWKIVQEVYLENNSLKYLSPVVKLLLTSRSRPKTLSLSGNHWQCACNSTEVKNLMIAANNVVDFQYIACKSLTTGSFLFLKNITKGDVCLPDDPSAVLHVYLPVLAAIFFITVICSTIVYRFRAEIRLYFLTHGYCHRFLAEEEIDANKTFDAFISYSTTDEEWVGTHLVPGLENWEPGYTVCVHSRNWPVGEYITEMVHESLKQSRRIIIVLTDNYVNSEWCRFEFQAAYKHSMMEGVNRVLVVVPEKVPAVRKLTKDLQAFITLRSYVKWEDPYFWRKLRCSMPKANPPDEENYDDDEFPMLQLNE